MNKKSKVSETENTARVKYGCPKALEYLIGLSRRFHPNGLLDVDQYANRVKTELSEENYKKLTTDEMLQLEAIKIFKDMVKEDGGFVFHLLKNVYDEIGQLPEGATIEDYFFPGVHIKFLGQYLSIKRDLDNIYKFAHALNKSRNEDLEKFSIESERFEHILIPTITKEGKVRMASNTFFLEAVDGIDADRLRICKICSKIFWAKRKKSKTCSPPCLNTLTVRSFRSLSQEEKNRRKMVREANKQRREELKEIRKKNGNL